MRQAWFRSSINSPFAIRNVAESRQVRAACYLSLSYLCIASSIVNLMTRVRRSWKALYLSIHVPRLRISGSQRYQRDVHISHYSSLSPGSILVDKNRYCPKYRLILSVLHAGCNSALSVWEVASRSVVSVSTLFALCVQFSRSLSRLFDISYQLTSSTISVLFIRRIVIFYDCGYFAKPERDYHTILSLYFVHTLLLLNSHGIRSTYLQRRAAAFNVDCKLCMRVIAWILVRII